jgi:hypothetical protein
VHHQRFLKPLSQGIGGFGIAMLKIACQLIQRGFSFAVETVIPMFVAIPTIYGQFTLKHRNNKVHISSV